MFQKKKLTSILQIFLQECWSQAMVLATENQFWRQLSGFTNMWFRERKTMQDGDTGENGRGNMKRTERYFLVQKGWLFDCSSCVNNRRWWRDWGVLNRRRKGGRRRKRRLKIQKTTGVTLKIILQKAQPWCEDVCHDKQGCLVCTYSDKPGGCRRESAGYALSCVI